MELDDWDISAEELDFLERDAILKVNERKASSAAASSSSVSVSCSSPLQLSAASAPSPFPSPLSPADASRRDATRTLGRPLQSPPARANLQCRYEQLASPPKNLGRSPTKADWVNPRNKGEALSPSASCTLGRSGETGHDPAGNLPKLSVRLYLHASGDIAAKFSYHQLLVDAFHKIPRASWHAKERLWMFPKTSLLAAEEVLNGIVHVNVEVFKLDPLVHRALAAASAAPDLQGLYDRIPSFLESKLLPFQRDGVRFLLHHGGRALLADEMGLGKTLQAIAFTACARESWPVLILSPSSLRLQWASMIQHWLNIPSSDILVVLSQYGGSNRGGFNVRYSSIKASVLLDGVFNIISYDIAQKLQDVLLESEFKIVIADESHFLKNAQAKRTNASVPILQKAKYAILLSGTPALSRPIELFKQLQALYPEVYKNVHEYGNRYCRGGFFGVYQGASNHEELHNLMKATVMIRRLKKDVLSELPVKRRQQVFLELAEKDLKQIRLLFRELEVIKNNIQSCDSMEKVESLKLSRRNIINKIYNDSAEAKIPAVLDYLGTVVEAGCKFLIFAHHQPMIDSIHKFLLKKKVDCIRIDGRTPSSTRQELISQFQENDGIKAAVLSIRAAGVGLTLTAASTVIFAELSWTPGDIIQAEDRAHRIGQAHSVNIYYLLANETVDDIIWDVVQGKLENLGQVLDGHENTLDVWTCEHSDSPSRQTTLDPFLKCSSSSSPAKQTTLDSFLKCSSSPAKQTTLHSFLKCSSSPAKQRTMDSFLKRCPSATEEKSQPKIPRK